jgi:hypothetical protein
MQAIHAKSRTSGIYSGQYNGDLRFIKILKERRCNVKLKQSIEKTISFLDEINFGDDQLSVKKAFGEPISIYRNRLSKLPHTVYTYGLKSGSKKIRVEIHFLSDSFFLGTVHYLTGVVNHVEINHQINSVLGVDSFHFVRNIIVDPSGHFIEFHRDPHYLIMVYSKLNWIESTGIHLS